MLSKGKRVDIKKYFTGLFYGFIFCFIGLNQNAEAAVPSPWINQEVGPAVNSAADFVNNQFTLNARGMDIGGIGDVFDFVNQPFTDDVEIIAKVESFGMLTISPKAGIMIRESSSMGSKNVFMGLTKGAASTFQRRTSTSGGTTTTNGAVVNAPYWLKLTRQGSAFKAYQSADGNVWIQVGTSVSVTMAANVYVGLAFTSKNNTTTNNAVFSNVSVRPAVAPSAPVLFSATAGVAQVDLSWNASSTATSYKVKYGTVSGSYTTTLTLGNVTSTSVTGLSNGTQYYFVVTAVNDYGESVVSNQMSVTPLDPPMVFIKKIDYNAMGQKTRIEYGNGVITTNTYDPLNLRLKRIYSVNASGQVLQDLSYTYDSAGNILSITDGLNTASQIFQYDALNRLTQANGTSYGVKNYQYDPIGNIVQKNGKIYSYAEGGAGVHAVTSLSDGTTMTYDANGNMASKQKGSELTLFIYDAENRLLELKKNGVTTAKYEYDGDGGRVKKTVGSTVTRYVGSLYEETNGVKTRHIFVGDLKVASITGANQMFYHTDHLGGTNVLTDKVGVKKELTEYEPYGTFARHDKYGTGAEVANFYFTGQRFDEESGLYYYGGRYYDSALGRFISADKFVPSTIDSQSYNRYSYVRNNPMNLIDPTGHFFQFLIDFILMAVVSYSIDKIIQGAATGDWSGFSEPKLKNFAIENLSIGIFSFGSPIAATASFITNRIFETQPGKEVQRWVGKEIFDDAFGMSPRTSHIAANISLQVAGSLTVEKIIVNDMGRPVTTKKNLSRNELIAVKEGEYSGDETIFGPSLKSTNAFQDKNIQGLYQNGKLVGSIQERTLDVPFFQQIKAKHISANLINNSQNTKINPLTYGAFGVCHTATNVSLLNAGVSSNLLDLNPSYDVFITTVVYGSYGGQLGNRIYAGYEASTSKDE